MKHYKVVAAVIVDKGKYLCLQRGKTKFTYTTNKWEFPGGKVEVGETEPKALKREILEEMDYPIEVNEHLITVEYRYPDFSIALSAYICTPLNGSFILNEHQNYKWLEMQELDSLDWAAADIEIVNEIKKKNRK